MSDLRMGDDIAPAVLTTVGPLDAVGGYVGGSWPDYPAMVSTFPSLKHLAIAVNASEHGDCLDVERGDATPADVPGWLASWTPFGNTPLPVIYINLGMVRSVLGVPQPRPFLLWTAHWNMVAHRCTPAQCDPAGNYGLTRPADGTQFSDHGGAWDESLVSPSVFTPADPPKKAIPLMVLVRNKDTGAVCTFSGTSMRPVDSPATMALYEAAGVPVVELPAAEFEAIPVGEPVGPRGPEGPVGPQGPAGPAGEPGAAASVPEVLHAAAAVLAAAS